MKRSGNSLWACILSDFWIYEFQLREFLNINSHHVTLFSWLLYWWFQWSVVSVASSEKTVSVRTCIWKVYSLQSTYEPKSLWQWTIWRTTFWELFPGLNVDVWLNISNMDYQRNPTNFSHGSWRQVKKTRRIAQK